MRPSHYTHSIIAMTACTPDEARHAEGYMRLTFGTLDHLGGSFKREAKKALVVARENPELAESNARSYGL